MKSKERHYLDEGAGLLRNCNEACTECNGAPTPGETNCQFCNTEDKYYLVDGLSETNCVKSYHKYYLDTSSGEKESFIFRHCSTGCKTCNVLGNDNDTNCTLCDYDESYFPVEDRSNSNCIKDFLEDNWFGLQDSKNLLIACDTQCPWIPWPSKTPK